MFSLDAKTYSLMVMYITGVILVPVVMASPTALAPSDSIPSPTTIASPASDDFSNLVTIINTAADSISAMANSNTGWNFFGSGDGQMGTADLVNNITATILRSKFQLDTNKTSWLLPTQTVDAGNPQLNNTTPSPWTPTLPLSSSLSLPSVLPTSTPTLVPSTPELSIPYIDYVSSVANLSANLISRGRTWHREMNAPVHDSIDALQQSISILQSGLLQSELINSQAVVRTIRASSTLEDAQQAWSRFLNLPGPGGNTNGDDVGTVPDSPSATTRSVVKKRETKPAFTPTVTRFYTHQELWDRKEGANMRQSNRYDRVIGKDQHTRNNGERQRAFTA